MHKCPHKPKPRDPEQRSANFRLFSCLPRAWPPPKCKHLLLDTSSHPCCLGRHCLGIRFLERRCLVLGCHTYYQTLTTLCDTYYLVTPATLCDLLLCVAPTTLCDLLPCLALSCHTYYQTPTTLCDTYYLVRHQLPYLVLGCHTYYQTPTISVTICFHTQILRLTSKALCLCAPSLR